MHHDIGKDAGRIWQALEQEGALTPSALARRLELKPVAVERAIGWLAREDKLQFAVDPRGATRISLKQD